MQTDTKARARPKGGAAAAVAKARHQHAGGLIIKCRRCKTERSFYTRKPLERYLCFECKEYTPLPPALAPVEVICECGKTFKYQTNVTDPLFDARCVECSAPVAVEYDEKAGRYLTIGAERRDRRRPSR